MTYANGRIIHDADAHTMETGDWLAPYLDADLIEALGPLYGDAAVGKRILGIIEDSRKRKSDPEADAAARENVIAGTKGWGGYGAFDTDERKTALDALGFQSQLVFPTFGLGLLRRAKGDDQLYRAAHALNCAQAAFCASDKRLLLVAFVPMDDPKRALELLEASLELGAAAIMVSAGPPGGKRSPGHPDYDPFWATMAEAGVPFVLHIGPGTMTQPEAYRDNGRERAADLHGGGENLRFPDFMCVGLAPQMFLTAMAYDGVFQRHPTLRGGVIECGAGWVPSFLLQLDYGYKSFQRTDKYLQEMDMKPSEYIRRAIKVTPFAGEDVGVLIRQAGPEMFLFSSDYPHPEGTRDPIGQFEKSLGDFEEDVKDKFYRTNFEGFMGTALKRVAVMPA